MSETYSGLEAILKEVNPLIFDVFTHSLNLVGSSSVECCKLSKDFFALLHLLYNFFSCLAHRWTVLQSYFDSENLSLKTLNNTKSSAREEACKSLNKNYKAILLALEYIVNDEEETKTTKSQAKGILKNFTKVETTFMSVLCGVALDKFNSVSEKIKSPKMNVATVVKLYNSLILFVQEDTEMFNFYRNSGENKLKTVFLEVRSIK